MVILIFTILMLILIGMSYYSLAEKYQKKNLWLWAILGIVAYFAGGIILAIFFGFFGFLIMDLLSANGEFYNYNLQGIENLLGLIGGIICSFSVYQIFKYRWKRIVLLTKSEDILDDNLGSLK